MQALLQRADSEVRTLRLNFYKKAKFANSFKWRLIENGVEPSIANEVTQVVDIASFPESARSGKDHRLGAVSARLRQNAAST